MLSLSVAVPVRLSRGNCTFASAMSQTRSKMTATPSTMSEVLTVYLSK